MTSFYELPLSIRGMRANSISLSKTAKEQLTFGIRLLKDKIEEEREKSNREFERNTELHRRYLELLTKFTRHTGNDRKARKQQERKVPREKATDWACDIEKACNVNHAFAVAGLAGWAAWHRWWR